MSQLPNKRGPVPCCTTMELLTIFKQTEAAYPATRAEQLNIKAHSALCARVEARPPASSSLAPSEPSGSLQASSQSVLPENGITKLPAKYWTRRGLELKCIQALNAGLRPEKSLDLLEMIKPYVKHGVTISENDREELILAINEAEHLCLDPELDEYKITPLTRSFVRGYVAGKGFKEYVQ